MKAGETKEECIIRLYLQNYSERRIRAATGIRGPKVKDTIQYFQQYPIELIIPAIFISITMLSFNLLGDKLRDAFDPKLRR